MNALQAQTNQVQYIADTEVRATALRRRIRLEQTEVNAAVAGNIIDAASIHRFTQWLQEHTNANANDPQPLRTRHIEVLQELIQAQAMFVQDHDPIVDEANRVQQQQEQQDVDVAPERPQLTPQEIAAERAAERRRQREQALAENAAREARRLQQDADIQAMNQRYDALQRDVDAAIVQQFNQRVHEPLAAAIQNQNQRVDALAEEVERDRQILNGRVQVLEAEIAGLERHGRTLDEQIATVRQGIDQARLEDLQLQKLLDATQAAVKKKKKQWIKDVVKAVVIVGACILATWALQAAISATTGAAAAGSTAAGAGVGATGGTAATGSGMAHAASTTSSFGMNVTPKNGGASLNMFLKFQ